VAFVFDRSIDIVRDVWRLALTFLTHPRNIVDKRLRLGRGSKESTRYSFSTGVYKIHRLDGSMWA